MGLLDRSIDIVVESHPDKDHIEGLADVFARYQVSHFIEPGVANDTAPTKALLAAVAAEPGVTHTLARRGMRIHLGGEAYADILYPDRDVTNIKETNDGSIAMRVVYGTSSFMLTGDLPSNGEDHLVLLDAADDAHGTELQSTVLKAGHHGSKFSSDTLWLRTVHPSVVVISAGKDNTYGHPSPEAIGRIQAEGAKIVSTIDLGTIEFVSDGTKLLEKDLH
jgi:competence protein ComEC